jgi:hypothetical protein
MEKKHAKDDAYEIARVYANRGDLDRAFSWFDRAYRQRDFNLLMIKVDPLLKNVRSDPRYKTILRNLRLPE